MMGRLARPLQGSAPEHVDHVDHGDSGSEVGMGQKPGTECEPQVIAGIYGCE